MLRKKLKLDVENATENANKPKTTKTNSQTTSEYFVNDKNVDNSEPNCNNKLLDLQKDLNNLLKPLKFNLPVAYCYNPAEYAFATYSTYVNKYCTSNKQVLFVGMNPGPFGMCQTGVPFGEIAVVRDWLEIEGNVSQPDRICPERPILGFSCTKSEISGRNFWGLFKDICKRPEKFFNVAFVYNYCPLAFMRSNGANITPNVLKGGVKAELEETCNRTLANVIEVIKPKFVVGVGKYAYEKCRTVTKHSALNTKIIYMIHPSPIIPKNQDWPEKAKNLLLEEDLLKLFEM